MRATMSWSPSGPMATAATRSCSARRCSRAACCSTRPRRGDVIVFKLPSSGHIDYIKQLVRPARRPPPGPQRPSLYQRQAPPAIDAGQGRHAWTTAWCPNRRRGGWRPAIPEEPGAISIQIHGCARAEAGDNTGVYVVPPHCYFMMGDNRENSLDSRFDPGLPPDDPKLGGCGWDSRVDGFLPPEAGVGFVPEDNLVGKRASSCCCPGTRGRRSS